MNYSNGNYEAFARPRKPRGVDEKAAYLIGGGIAWLAAAAFLIRDGQMGGDRITIYEASAIVGGALDGAKDPTSSAASARWRTTTNARGICSARSPRWRRRASRCSTSSTG